MPRPVQIVEPIPAEDMKAAVDEFLACALQGLEGRVSSQRKLAIQLDWAESTVSSALKGRFTFSSWPRICHALGLEPIDALVRGRQELRVQREKAHEQSQMAQAAVFREMLEDTRIETMVSFWRKLPPEKRVKVAGRLVAETGVEDAGKQAPQM